MFVLVVLLGLPLIYHGGSRLVPEEAAGPPQGRCGCVSTSPDSRILNGTQSSEMGLYDLGSLFGFGRATTVARRQVFGSFDPR